MLCIKLSRFGKKKQPMYRLIIQEKARDPYGKALEILGSYNPFTKELVAKNDRITYWIGQGAQTTPTVNNLLITKKVISGEQIKVWGLSQKKRAEISASAKATADKKVEAEKVSADAKAMADKEEVKEAPVVVETPAEEIVETENKSE